MNTSIPLSWRTNIFFTIILSLFDLSHTVSNNLQIFLYLNGLNKLIEHLDIFWNIQNFIKGTKKWSICFDDSKYGAFTLGYSAKEFNIESRFGIFYHAIG